MDLHEPPQPVTGSPAAAFDLLLSRTVALPLREMVQDREWNLHLLGAALSHLRSLGLVEVVPGAEPARFSLTPWARERSTLVGKVLARSEKANWQPEDRERLRCSVEAALEQQPGRLLVYASDGTECQDLDFKGCRSTVFRPEWLMPEGAPDLIEVTSQAIDSASAALTRVAGRMGLLGPGQVIRTRPDKEPAPVFEVRPGGHLRFRPGELASGRPLRAGPGKDKIGAAPAVGERDIADEAMRRQIADEIRTALADEAIPWQVRATPGINAIDIFPRGHDKALARDHLLTTGPAGHGRQVVSIADRIDGNDAPLFSRPLPGSDCSYLFLSVASDEGPLLAGLQRGLSPAGVRIGHLGAGSRRTERFLNRLLVLRRKGRSQVSALVRSLQEEQQTRMGGFNAAAAEAISRTWAFERPVTLAFDIDGTLNMGEGKLPTGGIPELLLDLDRWGFQLAVITGKTMARLRKTDMLGLCGRVCASSPRRPGGGA
jgi:hypothetical protein